VFDLPFLDYSGLQGEEGIEVMRGDITDLPSARDATADVSAVIHLAAYLPPISERGRNLTFLVNVDGTLNLANKLQESNPQAPFVFSSSVSTYGDTTDSEPPVSIERPQHALDIYAESKIEAEKRLHEVMPRSTTLRIAGISVPAFQEPPDVWPFMADQRIEFVHRDDVVAALCAAAVVAEAQGHVFNIAGGPTWRMTGKDYVADYFDLLGVPVEEAAFREEPGWFDWYDTGESQRILGYQNTSYGAYLAQLQAEVQRLMEE
jgi:nucleoside-diphosphate-sugar epimerase